MSEINTCYILNLPAIYSKAVTRVPDESRNTTPRAPLPLDVSEFNYLHFHDVIELGV